MADETNNSGARPEIGAHQLQRLDESDLLGLLSTSGIDHTTPQFMDGLERRVNRRVQSQYGVVASTGVQKWLAEAQTNIQATLAVVGEALSFLQSVLLARVIPVLAVPMAGVLEIIVFADGIKSALGLEESETVAWVTAVIMELFYLAMAYALAVELNKRKEERRRETTAAYALIVLLLGFLMIAFGTIGRIGQEDLDLFGALTLGIGKAEGDVTASKILYPLLLGFMSFVLLVAEFLAVHVLQRGTAHLMGKAGTLSEMLAMVDYEQIRQDVLIAQVLAQVRKGKLTQEQIAEVFKIGRE